MYTISYYADPDSGHLSPTFIESMTMSGQNMNYCSCELDFTHSLATRSALLVS